MPRETISTNEKQFILQALKQNIRVDGRTPTDIRHIEIRFGDTSGTVEVQVGRSRAVACVSGDIVAPMSNQPNDGFLNFFVDFSPMASPYFELGRPSSRCVEVGRIVERGIKDSRAIDTEALCIIAGEKVWSIRVDIHILDHNGNLTDLVNLAAVTALLHYRRPDVTVIGDTFTVHSVDDRQPVPLALHHIPITCTVAYFDEGNSFVMDPSLKEELCCLGTCSYTLNIHRELCCLQKSGGVAVTVDTILKCAHLAALKTNDITALIQARLKEDADLPKKRLLSSSGNVKPIEAFGLVVSKPATESSLLAEHKGTGVLGDSTTSNPEAAPQFEASVMPAEGPVIAEGVVDDDDDAFEPPSSSTSTSSPSKSKSHKSSTSTSSSTPGGGGAGSKRGKKRGK